MAIRLGLALLGLIHGASGLWMLAAPAAWYAAVPGVPASGPMNPHFIADIGLAFLASGAGLMLGARRGEPAAVLALAGAAWPALHALLHVRDWLADGFPASVQVAATELIGVAGLAALGLALALARTRQEGQGDAQGLSARPDSPAGTRFRL